VNFPVESGKTLLVNMRSRDCEMDGGEVGDLLKFLELETKKW
jgi:hypothetical protein